MILVQISASVSGVTVVCMAISETGCQDHGTISSAIWDEPSTLFQRPDAPSALFSCVDAHAGLPSTGDRQKDNDIGGHPRFPGTREGGSLGLSFSVSLFLSGALDDMGDEHEQSRPSISS